MISEIFLTSISTLGIGFLTAALGVCYKSKCSEMDCFCFHIKRDTKTELREDLAVLKIGETAPNVQEMKRRSF